MELRQYLRQSRETADLVQLVFANRHHSCLDIVREIGEFAVEVFVEQKEETRLALRSCHRQI